MRKFAPLIAALALLGCEKTAEPKSVTAAPPPPAQGGGIAPIGSGAMGGMTPVTGAESVGGGGFAGGGVAKDMARSAASKAGGSSIGQETGE